MNTRRAEIAATILITLSAVIGWGYLLVALSTKLLYPSMS